MRVVYLDWNATTPPHPDVVAAMVETATSSWGNPASVHGPGRRARSRVEDAREAVAALVGFDPRDVVLTSGGTEANNLALHHAFAAVSGGSAQPALVVSRIEHPSVVRFAEHLAARGVLVAWVEPEPSGRIAPEAVAEAMDRAASAGASVRLVALQAVNHETGVIQPVAAVASLCRSRGALLHVDAVQAVGKLPRSTFEGADLVSVAAHKIRGPKGIGALLTAPSVRLSRLLYGGSQERGLRPGTQDPVAAAGFAVAAERARRTPARYAELAPLRDRLQAELVRLGHEAGAEPLPNGDAERAPHVTNLSFPGWRGEELCAALDLERVAVSSGSACSAGTAEPSPVLAAMVGEARALAAVRISLGEETTADDVDEALARFARVLGRTRPAS
ncbi:cysteine desulfurase family protein [Polyangium jinanense]|uniref:Cysteine desulfurase n=1 Tax=Polyangium jinanense TaxID=2829994 RepID=A0A9X3XAB8_9BACT|nr:cysteine desulfurase family protein [Polyangium jinanense]MDC3958716.1 cysteine desulfurase [Polyangium jinanense]MDC3985303.1 cysteine desulfurase [Polyangium jinanense]